MRRLVGIHAVSAAVRAARETGSGIDRVCVAKGTRNKRLTDLVDECRASGIPVRFETGRAMRRLSRNTIHQNVVAFAVSARYRDLDEVLAGAPEECTLVALDAVKDPRNLGAIIRAADGAGALAVMVPERRSARLGEAASKAAAGALESLPVVRVKNLARALDRLKKDGFWVYGLDAEARTSYVTAQFADRTALVLGSESAGLRPKVRDRCDFLLRIPLAGSVSSLNVSVAAGIALFEVGRQRRVRHESG